LNGFLIEVTDSIPRKIMKKRKFWRKLEKGKFVWKCGHHGVF